MSFILALEATAYHLSRQMLFGDDAKRVCKLWKVTGFYAVLNRTNPKGPNQVASSPLLCGCGDHILYNFVVRLTCLSRHPSPECIVQSELNDMGSTLHQLEHALKDRLSTPSPRTQPALEIYRMFLGRLSATLNTLREPSKEFIRSIDCIVFDLLEGLSKVRDVDMNHATTTWPVQILTCAIRLDSDFERFKSELVDLKLRLEPGHKRHLESVVDEVDCVRLEAKNAPGDVTTTISPALSLLGKHHAILS